MPQQPQQYEGQEDDDDLMEEDDAARKRSLGGKTGGRNFAKGPWSDALMLPSPPVVPPSPTSRQDQKRAKVASNEKGLPKKNLTDMTKEAPITETQSGLRGAQ